MKVDEYEIASYIRRAWRADLLGSLEKVEIEMLVPPKQEHSLMGDGMADLFVAVLSAAVTADSISRGSPGHALANLRSHIDIAAATAFGRVMQESDIFGYIAVSEAKDASGISSYDPLKLPGTGKPEFGIAVDVVDGTSLVASCLPGAYSLAAASRGMRRFPDIQAFAVMAQCEILDEFDFFDRPEKSVIGMIESLVCRLGRKPSELRIVTHSSDTGQHHMELIESLRSCGVDPIIPDPVIVEQPYILSAGLGLEHGPDAMVGVFGLPEIVIGTLLLGMLDRGQQLRFRPASSLPLRDKASTSLNPMLILSEDELVAMKKVDSVPESVYDYGSIVGEKGSVLMAATAITKDPILGIHGIVRQRKLTTVESFVGGFRGALFRVATTHHEV